jgi:hypothetical protein
MSSIASTIPTTALHAEPTLQQLRWESLDEIGQKITAELQTCLDPARVDRLLQMKNEVNRMKGESR